MADPIDRGEQNVGDQRQGNAARQSVGDGGNQSTATRTDGGLGQKGQSGEQRNDAANDPNRRNTGVTGH